MIRSLIVAVLLTLFGASAAQAQYYNHNGSVVYLEWDDEGGDGFVVTYDTPKNSLRGVVSPGTVLFHGASPADGSIYGQASVFSSKCGSTEYEVTGRFNGNNFSLSGPAPVLNTRTCRDMGLSWDSPNARLNFRYLHD